MERKILNPTSVAFLLAFAILILLGLQAFKTKEYEIEGLTYYTDEAFVELIKDSFWDEYSIVLSIKDAFGSKKKIPYIETYKVSMEKPGSIKIKVYEKVLVGCFEMMGTYMYFDKDGIITESAFEKQKDVPLVTGLEFRSVLLNEKMEIQNQKLFSRLLEISKQLRLAEIYDVSIDFGENDEITLYIDEIIVKLGRHENYDVPLALLPDVLEQVTGRRIIIDMTDCTTGSERFIGIPY